MLLCFLVVMDGLAADVKYICKTGFCSAKLDGFDNKKFFGHLVSEVRSLHQDIFMVKGDMRLDVVLEFQIESLTDEFSCVVFVRYAIEQWFLSHDCLVSLFAETRVPHSSRGVNSFLHPHENLKLY